jgi:hypothetical protein
VSVEFSICFARVRNAARTVSHKNYYDIGDFVLVCCRCGVLRSAQNGLKGRCSTTEPRPYAFQYTKFTTSLFAATISRLPESAPFCGDFSIRPATTS